MKTFQKLSMIAWLSTIALPATAQDCESRERALQAKLEREMGREYGSMCATFGAMARLTEEYLDFLQVCGEVVDPDGQQWYSILETYRSAVDGSKGVCVAGAEYRGRNYPSNPPY